MEKEIYIKKLSEEWLNYKELTVKYSNEVSGNH